jgi:hypothetical protein
MKVSLKTNILLDLVLFLAMALTSISGVVIKIIAPLRRMAKEAWVRDAASWVLSCGRRLWADIHLWAGVVTMVLMLLHIVFHWQTIDGFFKKHLPNAILRVALYSVLLVLLLLSLIPWVYAL